jgi:hypothetical protein
MSCLAVLSAAPINTAAADTPASTAPAASTPAAAVEPPPQPSAILHQPGLLTLGYADWDIANNENKLRQYASPPRGFFVKQLRYVPLSTAGNLGVVSLENLAQSDYRDYGQLALFGGKTHIDGLLSHNQFYEATMNIVPVSSRDIQEVYFQQLIARGFKVSTRYRMDQLDRYFDVGLDPIHQRTRYNDFVAGGRFGGGYLNLMYSDWRYTDRTQTLFNTHDQHWQAAYLRDIHTHSLEAKFSSHNLSADNAPNGHMQNMSLSDVVSLNSHTDASVSLTQDNLNLPVVQNAYVRMQQSATARLAHVWSPSWRGVIAAQYRKAERVNSDHTYVDAPRWQTFEGRINAKFGPVWRAQVRASTENLWASPLMAPTGSLLWNNRQNATVRLEANKDLVSTYLSWDMRRQSNDAQATTITSDVIHLGGNLQASPSVSLFGDLTTERFGAHSSQVGSPVLNSFAPSSRTLDIGVNWTMSPRWFMSTNYSGFWTSNDNPLLLQDANTSGHFLTANLEYRTPSGQEFGLIVSPWVYRDAIVSQMDSTPTIFMVTASTPF